MSDPVESEKKSLSNRHVQFIAIGGAIGAGLFVGSSEAISQAGPAVIVAYAVCGFMIFLIARAMGELAIHHPDAGGFSVYAARYIGDWAGFVTGWSYWLNWVLVVIAEITAVSLLVRFWMPSTPQWLPGLVALGAVWVINRTAARIFAETEFWITLIKVATIILLIVAGTWAIAVGRTSSFGTASFTNLVSHDGIFPKGVGSLLNILPLILFAFGGVEVIGVAAAEMQAPEKTVPRAVNATVFRILLFYVGALAVAMSLVPWNRIEAGHSPFVLAFGALGVPGAASIVNVVVLTAVISSCNTGVFATSRVLRGLALAGQAPAPLTRLNRRGVPTSAMSVSVGSMLIGVLLNYVMPDRVFSIVMRADAALMLWIWLSIVWAHMNFRKRSGAAGRNGNFRMPFAPYSNLLVMVFIAFICSFNFLDRTSAAIFMLSLAWFGGLIVVHSRLKSKRPPLEAIELPARGSV